MTGTVTGEAPVEDAYTRRRQIRVLFITNIPSPYQVDFFTALSSQPEIQPTVVFCARSEVDRHFSVPEQFGFQAIVLDARRRRFMPKDWHSAPGLTEVLHAQMPVDLAVVSGSYFMPSARVARSFLIQRRIPWFYWGEDPNKKQRRGLAGWLKNLYLRRFLEASAGVFAIGSRARVAYHRLVHAGQPVIDFPYAPDLSELSCPTESTRSRALCIRREWGSESPLVVMFSGSFTHRKGADILIEAFAKAARQYPQLRLLLVGDGPLREQLKQQAASLGLSDRIRFLGFLEGDELRSAYLSADVMVLPTRTHEGWGVVVQEAMAAGLPVIAADRVGSAADLVAERQTGWIVPPGDSDAIADRLREIADSCQMLASMSERCRTAASATSSGPTAERLADYLRSYLLQGSRIH